MNLFQRFVGGVARQAITVGSLTMTFPDGSTRVLGRRDEPGPSVTIHNGRVWRRLARGGVLGFAESYIQGDLDTPDLQALLQWGAHNHAAWRQAHPTTTIRGRLQRVWQRWAPKRRAGKIPTMVDHYDLGNEFYSAWLDPTMTYSSARFASDNSDLTEAQIAKYRSIADLAHIEPGMRVLEIGCGWGGFAEYAARELGCQVVSLTISPEQARFARDRITAKGLDSLVTIRLEDFRDTRGRFDRIVSIEMIESINDRTWPALFETMHRLLEPGGRAVLQAITIEDAQFEKYRTKQDFIQRYIFPGGQLPSPGVLHALATDAGFSWDESVEFGADYAVTLAQWLANFDRAWETIADMGFDEPFRRMWRLYLAYCEAGFRAGQIDVLQVALQRSTEYATHTSLSILTSHTYSPTQ